VWKSKKKCKALIFFGVKVPISAVQKKRIMPSANATLGGEHVAIMLAQSRAPLALKTG